MTLDPLAVREADVGGRDEGQAVVEGPARLQVNLFERDAAIGQVKMGIRQPWDRDLVRVQLVTHRERVGPGLELDRRTGKRNAPVLDPDGLHPAEPRLSCERRDPPGDEGIEWHSVQLRGSVASAGPPGSVTSAGPAGSASSDARPAWSRPAPNPRASATRAFGPPR